MEYLQQTNEGVGVYTEYRGKIIMFLSREIMA